MENRSAKRMGPFLVPSKCLTSRLRELRFSIAKDMLNRLPWDLIYQEWWGEYPPEERTKYVPGRWKIGTRG